MLSGENRSVEISLSNHCHNLNKTMLQNAYLQTAILILMLASTSSSDTLKCASSRTKNSCQCTMRFDEMTAMPLIEARCQYLELQNFPIFDSDETVSSLDLSHNHIQELKAPDVSAKFGKTLFHLNFCHNSISNIDNNFFYLFPNLVSLDLSHNDLESLGPEELFDELEKLQMLDLSHNRIESLSDEVFVSVQNLKKLDLSYNPLHQVLQEPTALMDKLQINENLIHLSMDNVGVTRIHTKCWNYFKTLEYLSVADNPLDQVPQTSSSLEYLDISGTNIKEVHENDLKYTNLKTLKMSRMENLTSISPYAFYNLGNLQELVLTDSQRLSEFSSVAFGALDRNTFPRKLRKMELARNRLTTLNESYKYIFQEMEMADISFNPWSCNCDVLWMKEMDYMMKRNYDIRCSSPNDMTNRLVLELEPKDVPNCYPGIYGKKSHQTALLLLLILVFALIVVIVYLCLYSPSWSVKLGSSKMSPDSPYSINNEQM